MTFSSIAIRHLRQYQFCPRIPWYQEVAGIQPLRPLWVEQGNSYHHRQAFLSKRRKLTRYNLENADIIVEEYLSSEALGLHGQVDLLLINEDAVFPVEFKLAESKPVKGQILQVAAYGIVAEDIYKKPCPGVFVVTGMKAKAHYFILNEKLRKAVEATKSELEAALSMISLPATPAKAEQQCSNCEYLNYCNDRE